MLSLPSPPHHHLLMLPQFLKNTIPAPQIHKRPFVHQTPITQNIYVIEFCKQVQPVQGCEDGFVFSLFEHLS